MQEKNLSNSNNSQNSKIEKKRQAEVKINSKTKTGKSGQPMENALWSTLYNAQNIECVK